MKMNKNKKTSIKLAKSSANTKLIVNKSLKYDYIQAVNKSTNKIITSISTKDITAKTRQEKDTKMAENFAKILKDKKINTVVFDRNGYKFHGRIKLIADTLRKNGIKF